MRRGWIEERPGARGLVVRARYWVDGPDGEPVARSKSFPVAAYAGEKRPIDAAKAAARKHLAEVLTDQARGTFVTPSEMTVGELVATYLEAKVGSVRANTLIAHRTWAAHLPDELARRRVQGTTALHVQAAFGKVRETGAGPTIQRGLYVLLSAAFARAVEWQVIARSPMGGVSRPDYRPAGTVPWTQAHVGRFLAGTVDHEHGCLWRLALLTGMRRGELGALRWTDVDLVAGNLRVERTLTRDDAMRVVVGDRPKTQRSRRTVPLPPSCVAALERRRDDQRAARASSPTRTIAYGDLVFDRPDGRPLRYRTVDDAFAAEIRRLALPPLTVHGMRHTCATVLLLRGAHPNAVADLLGDRVETVMATYAHVLPDHRRAAVEALDAALTLTRTDSPDTTTREWPEERDSRVTPESVLGRDVS